MIIALLPKGKSKRFNQLAVSQYFNQMGFIESQIFYGH